jgi:anti-anti-sigma factor
MMSPDLLKVSQHDSVNVVELLLPDALDSTEFDRLNEALAGIFHNQTPQPWILDLTKVEYMGSAALGLMVNIRHQVKTQGGKLALCGMSPRLHSVFRACCLERLFTICRTREEAVRAVR